MLLPAHTKFDANTARHVSTLGRHGFLPHILELVSPASTPRHRSLRDMAKLRFVLLWLLIGSATSLLRARVGSSVRRQPRMPTTAGGDLHAWSPSSRHQPSPRMQDYDLGRKDFDFLELQSFRRETILQYSLINRSEQLRILLLSLSAVISACAPAIAAELFQREVQREGQPEP